ncbi:MAG TPA: sulfotransferase [Luteimonas sp.]|nr:sulfotransferase [Luteimonas sp.]
MTDAPDRAVQLRQRAELHASRREWPQAIATFGALLAERPDDADVLLQLSYMESLAGHYRNARGYALRAADARPRSPAIVAELLARLRTFNEAPALQDCLDALGPRREWPIPLLLAAANQLSNLNQQERALACLDEASRGDPRFPPTLLARAQVLIYLGRFDEAERDLRACLARAPEIAKTYYLLSRLGVHRGGGSIAPAVRARLSAPASGADDAVMLGFALHAELDRVGDIEGAWEALTGACAAKRARLRYDSAESRELVDALMAWTQPAGAVPLQGGPTMATPIFIVGMHRSGTTLLERLVEGSSQVQGLGELYDFTSQMRHATDHHCRGVVDARLVQRAAAVAFAAVGQGYLDGIAWRLGPQRCFTDKLPSNFLNLGFICAALPHARILHMHRDPVETCFSNLRELFSDANPYAYDQHELAAYYLQYRRLMRHWHQQFPGRIHDVDYAGLVADPEGTMRGVAEFCGLAFESAMGSVKGRTRAVATASAVSVRDEVARREVPKWQPYAAHLRPLRMALAAGGAIPAVD